jgi:hypothetical protein
MNRGSSTLLSIIKVMAILFLAANSSIAQDRKKEQDRPEQAVLRGLHPGLTNVAPPKGINLLAGYKHKAGTDFEGNQVGEISKNDGIKIEYEMGFSQGMAVDADKKNLYVWYREQKVNGREAKYALSIDNILIISVPLSDEPNTLHVANFYCQIRSPDDIADVLLMILPFAYK